MYVFLANKNDTFHPPVLGVLTSAPNKMPRLPSEFTREAQKSGMTEEQSSMPAAQAPASTPVTARLSPTQQLRSA